LIQDFTVARFLEPFDDVWRIKKFLNIGTEKRLKKALSIVQGYMMSIIRLRMLKVAELDNREDMLSSFASNKDHNEVVLRDAVTNFLLAGRESISTTLTWFFWLVHTISFSLSHRNIQITLIYRFIYRCY
jgi:cytochrome P450